MQITTTKPSFNAVRIAPQAQVEKSDSDDKAAPQESFISTVKEGALDEARYLADRVANVSGGAGGVIGASVGASVALAGGAIVGMAAGGAAAVPISQVFSSGGLDAIKTGLGAVGTGAKIGVGLSLVTLAAGGWVVGDKIASNAAKPFAYGTGLATGAAKSTLRHLGQESGALAPKRTSKPKSEKTDLVDKKSPLIANIQRGFGGVGALTGLAGGGTIGLAIGAGTEAISGLMSGDLGISGLTRAGLIGAGIGGVAGGIVGGIGGMKVADALHAGINGIAETSKLSRTLLEQDKRSVLLDEMGNRLEKNEADFQKEKIAGDANIEQRNQALDSRSKEFTKTQQTFNDRLRNESEITGERTDELYTNKAGDLAAFEGKLDADKEHLDSEKVRLTGKEADLDNLTRKEADSRREAHQAEGQSDYDNRKGNLESREGSLQQREQNIDQIANERVQSELQPIRDEAANARSAASSNTSEASRQRSEAQRLNNEAGHILSEASRYESRASSEESRNSSLRSEASSLSSRESSLGSSLSSCQADKRRKDDEKRRRDNGGGNGGHRDGSNYGGGNGGHRNGSKWG